MTSALLRPDIDAVKAVKSRTFSEMVKQEGPCRFGA